MKKGKWGIGIDIGGTKIIVAGISDEGKVLQHFKIPTRVKDGPAAIEKDIITEANKLRESAEENPSAIGVGMAGQILPNTGIVKFAPNLGWRNIDLQGNLTKALGARTAVMNDVRAATWAEWKYGAGKGAQNIVCLMIGTGIGGGIILDGKLMTGATNSAGELGHFPIDLNGPKCTCGNFGCLEALAAGWALAKQAKEAIAKQPEAGVAILKEADNKIDAISAKHVVEAARQGDPLAQQIVEKAIDAIIAGSIGYVNALNPNRLILAGGLGTAFPYLVERVTKGVKERALEAATANLQVVYAALTAEAVAIGAAGYALDTLQN